MSDDSLILVGVVVGTHGVRGELKVEPANGSPTRFQGVRRVYLKPRLSRGHTAVDLIGQRPHGRFALIKIEGITDPDQARALVGAEMCIPRSELPELGEDEYYTCDLIGLACESTDGDIMGVVADVLDMPANDVLVVQPASGREFLVPLVGDIVRGIDLAQRKVVIEDRPGLRD